MHQRVLNMTCFYSHASQTWIPFRIAIQYLWHDLITVFLIKHLLACAHQHIIIMRTFASASVKDYTLNMTKNVVDA